MSWEEYAKQNKLTPYELYKKLYDGETIQFNLLDDGSICGKPSFQLNKDYILFRAEKSLLEKLNFLWSVY